MTELMKRYEKETGKMAHEKVCDIDGWIETTDYIAWLEDQLRWRPVSEKPEKDGQYFVKVRFLFDKELGYGSRFYSKDFGWHENGNFTILGFLPIPPAPEGE